ncbi:fungal-specific transcription factor domain-containing protein [Pseudomassariella vexata]|uniref:Fungal-specific transcription factor domain-domain-containing protein n=1 Tax=Pseudomassariella vexata TaxID=1141098 RepID=A0A1Y2E7S2_9PEZI|nr:fungal-specific transcription factor domain-containing protein [Pseudomassariella vexata]ORY67589.1 fungal-specific transcription factor domain-domain-containing protein [Pseudomassariella vexata]
MNAESAGGNGGASPAGTRRACDQCRLRKIRCDKESPCANCKSAKRSCSSLGLGQKPKEPGQRVLISRQYERKLDDMQERLAGIESLLRNLSVPSASFNPKVSGQSSHSSSHSGPQTGSSADKETPSAFEDSVSTALDPEDVEPFEGGSSLTAHAAFASEFLENAVHDVTTFSGGSDRMEAALSSLRAMVQLQKNARATGGDEDPKGNHKGNMIGRGPGVKLKDLPMPPMDLVVEKLRLTKRRPGPMMLLVVTCFTDIDAFTDKCRRIYFSTDDHDIPISTFIVVNAALNYLFFENAITITANSPEKTQLEQCCAMCQANVETALAQLPLLMPATLENIEALLMGASFAIDLSRPSLAWLLTSRATHMCRALGLHQESSVRNDSPRVRSDKALLFWSTYMLDKGLSLRLGRASILQDYDISLPSVLEKTHGSLTQPSSAILSLWIKHSEVQGNIYQRLYSPGALRQTDATRMKQVEILVNDLKFLLSETLKLYDEAARQDDKESRMFVLILKSDQVSYFSSLALAYRAIPISPGAGTGSRAFADECLDTARAAMRTHQEAMNMMSDPSLTVVYLHWTILYAPFIPFIVIFCHAIETSNADDLRCLELFVQSLQGSSHISPAIDKLHQLSRMLYNVALLYVEAKAQQAMDQAMIPVGNEFDMYLSQLGFIPTDEGMGTGTGVAGGEGEEIGFGGTGAGTGGGGMMQTTNQLGDWFSGSNYTLGLVEEDLSSFNTSAW